MPPLVTVKKEKTLKITTGTDVPFSAPMVSLQAV
jgi:RNA 3'-terminal phosphate cyclase